MYMHLLFITIYVFLTAFRSELCLVLLDDSFTYIYISKHIYLYNTIIAILGILIIVITTMFLYFHETLVGMCTDPTRVHDFETTVRESVYLFPYFRGFFLNTTPPLVFEKFHCYSKRTFSKTIEHQEGCI